MDHKESGLVIGMGREHGAHNGNVVHLLRQMRHQLRNPDSRFSILLELEWAAQQPASLLWTGEVRGHFVEIGLAVVFVQHRLGIKEIHLAWPAVHKELDYGLRLRLKMRGSRSQIERSASRVNRFLREPGREYVGVPIEVLLEECHQCRSPYPIYHTLEKAAARQPLVHCQVASCLSFVPSR